MKVLNLYAGIGGNRKLWGDNLEITSVEYNEEVAEIYSDLYPNDNLIIGDAHQYLLDNYKNFDIIWASPPCQSHSQIRICGARSGQYDAVYPDMKLWQEIIFLQNYAKFNAKFVVENVRPYYSPFVRPTAEIGRHLFWSNSRLSNLEINTEVAIGSVSDNSTVFGINLKKYNPKTISKKQILRNMVDPILGKHIMDCLLEKDLLLDGKQGELFKLDL